MSSRVVPDARSPKRRVRLGRGIGLLLAALLVPAAARSDAIALDPVRSNAEFQVRVMWMFDVTGRFGAVTGNVDIDHAARTARVHARIDVRGVSMRRASYEDWVKSDEFFDAEQHPFVEFVSEPFPLATLDIGGDIIGHLTLRGLTKPMNLRLRPSQCPGEAALRCAVVADGTLQRSDFGMRSRRATLADRVRLHFSVRAASATQ
ncbi:MAG TPA: YceI family protein [Tahibacter sp.]|uniref:YceI family protein n=1 Tax=Tahibacter sp. TaxID=2056211 RepID=UPI002C2FF47B|nr:YceI family protein [Tahibacter sp.]HSX61794.1 YceI family protein [Tahibacter sp.]